MQRVSETASCQNRAEGRLRTVLLLTEITTRPRHLSFRLATALPPPVAWPADSLLIPRPRYELHGDALCYPEVHQPLRQLTASESELE